MASHCSQDKGSSSLTWSHTSKQPVCWAFCLSSTSLGSPYSVQRGPCSFVLSGTPPASLCPSHPWLQVSLYSFFSGSSTVTSAGRPSWASFFMICFHKWVSFIAFPPSQLHSLFCDYLINLCPSSQDVNCLVAGSVSALAHHYLILIYGIQ